MGAFHTSCPFLAVIGKRFADAGLKDILVEEEVVVSSAVAPVLHGKHFNRAMRSHEIVYEALFRRMWSSFEIWCLEERNVRIIELLAPLSHLETPQVQ
jgi:hypothetical protein